MYVLFENTIVLFVDISNIVYRNIQQAYWIFNSRGIYECLPAQQRLQHWTMKDTKQS